MFKPLFLSIALRYTRSKKQTKLISFITFTSLIGIALGVSVLITVLSVMNGFDEAIKDRVFGMARQVTVIEREQGITDWQALAHKIDQIEHVTNVAPFVMGQGMLKAQGQHQVMPIIVNGIQPAREPEFSVLSQKMLIGKLSDLKAGEFGVIIGQGLANQLGVMTGDKVNLFIPEATVTPLGTMPNFKRVTVKGIFEVGRGFEFDKRLAFMHMADASKLYRLENRVTGLMLKLDNLYLANQVALEISTQLPPTFTIQTWVDRFGPLFEAIKLEKSMMFIILLMIIFVAAFNLVSSLVMSVNEKRADIAIMRTLGATPSTILKVFITQGFLIGIFGTGLGIIGGIVLSNNIGAVAQWIEQTFRVHLLSSSVYYVDYLPSIKK